ncbi:MAG: hypothetical protein K9G33_16200, partial [Sneathiella sp.]|nr:hypothetical protein [Sneathiella sp.]
RADGLPLFNTVLHAVMTTANDIREFRTRFRGQTIIEHDVVHASYTVPIANDQFAFCETRYVRDWKAFDENGRRATEIAKTQGELTDKTAGEDHWIYLSCMPWLDFTAVQHPVPNAEDCIPRIAWGKMTEEGGRWHMAVNLQAHHALMDGLHAAKFFEGLEENLKAFQDARSI